MTNEAQAIASDPRTQESQRRARIETAVYDIMRDLSVNGVHAGTVIDHPCLEYIEASFRAIISIAERGGYR